MKQNIIGTDGPASYIEDLGEVLAMLLPHVTRALEKLGLIDSPYALRLLELLGSQATECADEGHTCSTCSNWELWQLWGFNILEHV